MFGRHVILRPIVPGVLQVPLFGTSAFLLLGDRVTLVDTGFRGSGVRLLRAVQAAGRRADEIERVIITHYHPDHLGGLAELQQVLPAKAAIHAVEASAVMSTAGPPSPFGNLALRIAAHPFGRRAFRFSPVRIDEFLHDGDEFQILGGMRVVHTPGHTSGHISLYFPDLALLIAGDSLESHNGAIRGPTPLFSINMKEAQRSVRKLAGLEVDVIALSHFPAISKGAGQQLLAYAHGLGNSAR
jgi:glyoxylase-like metal-dependent hydrolase (beta-lactamase superfamily II)